MIKLYIMNISKLLTITGVLLCTNLLSAQADEERGIRERVEAYRAQFLTEELDLSPKEAQVFWPVYNEYREELEKIQGDRMEHFGRHRGRGGDRIQSMSDEEVRQMVEAEMEKQQKLLDLRREYYKRFNEVLPIKKVARLYRAEVDFQRKLIQRMRDRAPSKPTRGREQ